MCVRASSQIAQRDNKGSFECDLSAQTGAFVIDRMGMRDTPETVDFVLRFVIIAIIFLVCCARKTHVIDHSSSSSSSAALCASDCNRHRAANGAPPPGASRTY